MILQSGCTNKHLLNNCYAYVAEKYHFSRDGSTREKGFSGSRPHTLRQQAVSGAGDNLSELQCSHLQNGDQNLTTWEGTCEDYLRWYVRSSQHMTMRIQSTDDSSHQLPLHGRAMRTGEVLGCAFQKMFRTAHLWTGPRCHVLEVEDQIILLSNPLKGRAISQKSHDPELSRPTQERKKAIQHGHSLPFYKNYKFTRNPLDVFAFDVA